MYKVDASCRSSVRNYLASVYSIIKDLYQNPACSSGVHTSSMLKYWKSQGKAIRVIQAVNKLNLLMGGLRSSTYLIKAKSGE